VDRTPTTLSSSRIRLRRPKKTDGAAVWDLIASCDPLDENSMYCNLIQCDHFADTCVLAEREGEAVGWVSGYLLPDDPETLFVWQVAVSPEARGEGLSGRMLRELLARDACAQVRRIQTTITDDNDASWALFTRFAEKSDADLEHETHFCRDRHFDGAHDTERLVTISLPEEQSKAISKVA
jgi:L-2,4-diaminobutyric acid acetyltransferase